MQISSTLGEMLIKQYTADVVMQLVGIETRRYDIGDWRISKSRGIWHLRHTPCQESAKIYNAVDGTCSKCKEQADEGILMLLKLRGLEHSNLSTFTPSGSGFSIPTR